MTKKKGRRGEGRVGGERGIPTARADVTTGARVSAVLITSESPLLSERDQHGMGTGPTTAGDGYCIQEKIARSPRLWRISAAVRACTRDPPDRARGQPRGAEAEAVDPPCTMIAGLKSIFFAGSELHECDLRPCRRLTVF